MRYENGVVEIQGAHVQLNELEVAGIETYISLVFGTAVARGAKIE
jgi:hypothetical protein